MYGGDLKCPSSFNQSFGASIPFKRNFYHLTATYHISKGGIFCISLNLARIRGFESSSPASSLSDGVHLSEVGWTPLLVSSIAERSI